ncbi:TnpV protein [Ihubacter sp. rT4E-8]|uniref:TnpV protein n=1 Tax=Ihubacter sp. rT4E-8 TaxID=3242369 RepID=UPI003CF1EA4F
MKSLFEQFGGTYRKCRDYLIPNLEMPSTDNFEIGIYGQRHLRYLLEHCKLTYINLLTSGKLNQYLADIDKQAQDRLCQVVKQLKTTQGITEQLKVASPMEWVRKMNCIQQQAEEFILNELIYQ